MAVSLVRALNDAQRIAGQRAELHAYEGDYLARDEYVRIAVELVALERAAIAVLASHIAAVSPPREEVPARVDGAPATETNA